MTSASADSQLPRLVASAPNGRQRLRDCETEREKECEKLREICIFTNRRLQLVALAIEFALSNKRKPTVGREEKKKKTKNRQRKKFNLIFFFASDLDSVLTNVLQLIVSWFLFHTLKWVRSPFLVVGAGIANERRVAFNCQSFRSLFLARTTEAGQERGIC